ncbi:5-formyltetrahydrofolate cyclo-ligase [Rhodovulum sp. DZ06]|uniref:5-formyltetrahydrofolate cyclo-ligase n=1 Tax=Rhodovulum sp. DZ06 TaxID=3425126 RepID=UPI003D356927
MTELSLSDAKAAARAAAFAARREAHRNAAAHAVAAAGHLLSLLAEDAARGAMIAGYMPIRTEIDPRPAMEALHRAGARLCLPVVEGDGLPLSFRRWTPGAPLVEGAFKALVPQEETPADPDVLILPLVAFDRRGMRLGYGGGFYDRTLAARPGLRAIGFAHAAQEAEALPTEATDMPLDAVATETGATRFR